MAHISKGATYFLSGVMGGSGTATSKTLNINMESQDYRAQIRDVILAADASAVIVDPLELGAQRNAELERVAVLVHWCGV